LLALACLGGCRLVDQRTFVRTKAPSKEQLAEAALPPLPTLTVSFAVPDANWRPSVQQAVLAAEAHNPDAKYDVVVPFPTAGNQTQQEQFVKSGQDNGQLVAQELQADGVPPERITIGFRGDPGSPAAEVRLYVR
jgi:hypothetical protein